MQTGGGGSFCCGLVVPETLMFLLRFVVLVVVVVVVVAPRGTDRTLCTLSILSTPRSLESHKSVIIS